MKTIISSSEIVGQFTQDGREFEVCATAEGNFDEGKSQLVVTLEGFIRPVDLHAKEKHLPTEWLPPRQEVKESVPLDEARAVARDIFHRWVGRVRQSVPLPMHS